MAKRTVNKSITVIPEPEYRIEGRHITANDVAQRLIPDQNINEVLLWPPDLFAYTSYIMAITSAYQLVVSPPKGQKWPPNINQTLEWLKDDIDRIFDRWIKDLCKSWHSPRPDVTSHIGVIKRSKARSWRDFVRKVGDDWGGRLNRNVNNAGIYELIEDYQSNPIGKLDPEVKKDIDKERKRRLQKLFTVLFSNTPPVLLALWACFYDEIKRTDFDDHTTVNILDLLCNQEHIQHTHPNPKYCQRLWKLSQVLLTMHAIADIAGQSFGLRADTKNKPAWNFAESLLFKKGTLSTIQPERGRVLPKRHNPSVGITLRSISSNLAFSQSAVDVVWRKARNNDLEDRLSINTKEKNQTFSMLLFPYPLDIRTKDFQEDTPTKAKTVIMGKDFGFFDYESYREKSDDDEETTSERKSARNDDMDRAIDLIEEANKDLPLKRSVDMVLFPETALGLMQFDHFEDGLIQKNRDGEMKKIPSVIIAGVRESRKELAMEMKRRYGLNLNESDFNFARNAVYCKYFNNKEGDENKGYYGGGDNKDKTPKYKQYKHHRWQLEKSQITKYGLSGVLNPEMKWWESIKIPKRRVSFMNIGDRITMSHLICEDLARQDPISELIRHVGPSLVVTILMDGPQLKTRWSARYASVLSDDPGCSVIALTSMGMVKKHSTEFHPLSRVVALWSESGKSRPRELELAQGAEAILLTFSLDGVNERTADGRVEVNATSIIRLVDVIQVYPNKREEK